MKYLKKEKKIEVLVCDECQKESTAQFHKCAICEKDLCNSCTNHVNMRFRWRDPQREFYLCEEHYKHFLGVTDKFLGE